MHKKQSLTNPNIADKEALQEFAESLTDRADAIERDLELLSKEPKNRTLINNIFRELHNLKGDASICRVALAEQIAHPLESLLERLRSGELQFSILLAEVILLSIDRMKLAVTAIVGGRSVTQLHLAVLIESLGKLSQVDKDDIQFNAVQLIKTVTGYQHQTVQQTSINTNAVQGSGKGNQKLGNEDLNLSSAEIDNVFKNVDIPTCPALVSMAMKEAQREEPDIRKLAAAIEKDVGMSALTIKLANSPLFRTNQPVSSVSTALARLGIRNVVCVVLAAALRSCMSGGDVKWLEKFWTQASLCASVAGLIARKQIGISPDEAYTFALFHDAAIPMLRKRFDNYANILTIAIKDKRQLIDVEEEYFPCTHPIVGSLMAKNWGLPSIISQSIRFHHEKDIYKLPESQLSGSAVSLIAVTHVAERLLSEHNENNEHINFEVSDEHYQHALSHLALSEEDLDKISELLADESSGI